MKRKILRNRAKLNMERAGIHRANKRPLMLNPRTGLMVKADSFFAEHWREYAAIKPAHKAANRREGA